MFRNITIRAAMNGWIVEVGCQTVVFEETSKLLRELGEYLNNPEQKEKQYSELPNAKYTYQDTPHQSTTMETGVLPELGNSPIGFSDPRER